MTELLYPLDSYRKEFSSLVDGTEENNVILSSTAFYPGGGGQPSDTGVLTWGSEQARVVSVKRDGPNVIHVLEGPLPARGTEVQGAIDWDRRYALMRTHTALHILCGVIFRDFGSQVTGGNMAPPKGRIDFELARLTPDSCQDIENRENREIEAAPSITWRIIPRDQAVQL